MSEATPTTQKRTKSLGYHFIPVRYQRANILMWLKRLHAWTGVWGALLFLFIGITGFLLDHRSIMKIDTGAPVETSKVTIPVEPETIPTAEELATWVRDTFSVTAGKAYIDIDAAHDVIFEGKTITAPEAWEVEIYAANSSVIATHTVGSNSVQVHSTENNLLGLLKNLHKGVGVGVIWILFLDMLAGALLFMSITGILLWSKLHGTRLLGAGLLFGSTIMALAAALPYILTSSL